MIKNIFIIFLLIGTANASLIEDVHEVTINNEHYPNEINKDAPAWLQEEQRGSLQNDSIEGILNDQPTIIQLLFIIGLMCITAFLVNKFNK